MNILTCYENRSIIATLEQICDNTIDSVLFDGAKCLFKCTRFEVGLLFPVSTQLCSMNA